MDNTKKNNTDAKKAGRTEFADDMNMNNSTTNKGNNKSNNSNK